MPLNKFTHYKEGKKITMAQLQIKSLNEAHKVRSNLIINLSFIIFFLYNRTAHNQSLFKVSFNCHSYAEILI